MKYDVLDFKNMAKTLNNLAFTDYYYRLKLLAMVVYKWENLPEEINERWIERFLFDEGSCMIFKDKTFGLMVSKCNGEGVNFYDEPVNLTPVATGYSEIKSYENGSECILITNNDLMIPTKPTIDLFAFKLANIDRTIDINTNAQKTPVLIKCSEKQRLTLTNVYNQWQGNSPVIYGDKQLDTSDMEVLKTDAPIVFDKLQIQKHSVWNECMTFLGINNANQDKRERLVSDEVDANDEQVEMSSHVFLKARQDAAQRINKLFGTDIKVSMRSIDEIKQLMNDSKGSDKGSEGGDDNA